MGLLCRCRVLPYGYQKEEHISRTASRKSGRRVEKLFRKHIGLARRSDQERKALHFFLTYVGRTYDFTARAKSLGQENYSTNRVSVGFIYQLPMF